MRKYHTIVSRKQMNVLYINYKKGLINLTDEERDFLFSHCCEVHSVIYHTTFEYILKKIKEAVGCCFKKNYSQAEELIKSSYALFASEEYEIGYK